MMGVMTTSEERQTKQGRQSGCEEQAGQETQPQAAAERRAQTPGAGAAGRGRKNSTREQRAELLKRYEMSGLTVTAFCRAQGLSRKKFSVWKNAQPGWATKKRGSGFRGRRSQAEREHYVREFERSGLTVAEFCREEGLSRRLFEQWQDSLRRRTGSGHAGFAEVALSDELTVTGGPAKAVTITVDSTITVSVPPGTGCLWVGGLLRCLRGK
jgi:transposase-like protein